MKINQPEVFDRLDQVYTCWEDHMWKTRVSREISKLAMPDYEARPSESGFPIDGSNRTKELLLEVISRGDTNFLLPKIRERFPRCPKINRQESMFLENLHPTQRYTASSETFAVANKWEELHFPYYLGKWNASSRRVYYLSDDLALQLQATSLKGLTFRDIKLPFSTFCIALESPLIGGPEGEFDFFLISEILNTDFALFGFKQSISKWRPTNPIVRTKIDEALRKGNVYRAANLSKDVVSLWLSVTSYWEAHVPGFPITGVSDEALDQNIEESLSLAMSASKYKSESLLGRFFRILFGLCVYLQTLTKSDSESLQKLTLTKKIYTGSVYGKALISTADILKVQSVIQLSVDEKEAISNQLTVCSGREVNAHFREGYWRRMPGDGKNSAAEKTVWVRPTIVRKDRLPKNTLPVGVGKIIA